MDKFKEELDMKKLLSTCMIVSGILFAQNSPIDFEPGGYGDTWTWTVFENDNNPNLEIIANPSNGGINSSANVAMFTALQAGKTLCWLRIDAWY